MKVLIVNTSERTGGAAVAASRLRDALNNNGVKARMLVRDKQTADITVSTCGSKLANKWNFVWERFVIWTSNRFSRENLFKVSIANTGINITKTQEFKEADVIHLHWVNQGMLSLKGIRLILQSGKPVVWTMHDMWPLTAICHHAYECTAYQSECSSCPFMRRPKKKDLSYRTFRKKMRILEELSSSSNLTMVAVSEWLAQRARLSALTGNLAIKVIPNVLSLSQFVNIDRTDARTALDIHEPYVFAFGAARIDDPIKGLDYLLRALQELVASGYSGKDIRLVLFGRIHDSNLLQQVPVPYTYMGYVDDSYRLSEIYSAANAIVSSSLYETFGQTLIEAMACGCVPVSFDGSGQTDIIQHKQNGYLAERLSPKSLAAGLAWSLTCGLTPQELRRSVLRRYGESVVANKYTDLYNDALDASARSRGASFERKDGEKTNIKL